MEASEREEVGVVLYTRVSSTDPKAGLDRQVVRLAAFATENNMRVAKVVAEVGSGLDGHGKGLLAVLRSPDDGALVVKHRDRWARFGSEYVEAALAATSRGVVVVDPEVRKGRSGARHDRCADPHVRASVWSPGDS